MSIKSIKPIDAVFEGGGVKGIGLVGAIKTVESQGYRFRRVAGTSAGAIVAALVAAGYNADELKTILESKSFTDFMDKGWEDHIPMVGSWVSLLFQKGIYEGHDLECWLRDLLAQKGKRTFGDLICPGAAPDSPHYYKLQVIASDLTRGEMLKLPQDIAKYGIDPNELDIAYAVRMSMSIPFFFEPVQLKDAEGMNHIIVDGGVLSNFPVWLFDKKDQAGNTAADPAWPTFGFRLVDPTQNQPNKIDGPLDLLKSMVLTMLKSQDSHYIKSQDSVRTIQIPTVGVGTTEFDLSDQKKKSLYQAGETAAAEFLSTWNFDTYKADYRSKAVPLHAEPLHTEPLYTEAWWNAEAA